MSAMLLRGFRHVTLVTRAMTPIWVFRVASPPPILREEA